MTALVDDQLGEAASAIAALRAELRAALLKQHGPLLSGASLAKALGHGTTDALRQALRRGQVRVSLFTLPERRGYFALTQDVADWLAERRLDDRHAINRETKRR